MGQTTTNDIRPGMKVEMNNEPFLVVSNEFVKPGKGQAFNRIRLKNMLTARVMEKTFKSGEKLDLADIVESQMRLLYTESENAVFMNDETFEQVSVPFSAMKENRQWLKEDTVYDVVMYKGEIIDIVPPTFMELKITETAPGIRGDTASGRVLKTATLESGAQVQIPIFVDQGEIVKIDTRTGEYVSRL
ncbi:MAG: elongation factor P [Parachlamydiales bacterium]|nr:elongation factor P [Parachlamydiales bacterium]